MFSRFPKSVWIATIGFTIFCTSLAGGAIWVEWKVKNTVLPKIFSPVSPTSPTPLLCKTVSWESYGIRNLLKPMPPFEGLRPDGLEQVKRETVGLRKDELNILLAEARKLVSEGKTTENKRQLELESARLVLIFAKQARVLATEISKKREALDKKLIPLQKERARVARRLAILEQGIGKTPWFRESQQGRQTGLQAQRDSLAKRLPELEKRLQLEFDQNQKVLKEVEKNSFSKLKVAYEKELTRLKEAYGRSTSGENSFPKTKALALAERIFKLHQTLAEEDVPILLRDRSKPSVLKSKGPVSIPSFYLGKGTQFKNCLYKKTDGVTQ